jgi:hypothetical protein
MITNLKRMPGNLVCIFVRKKITHMQFFQQLISDTGITIAII